MSLLPVEQQLKRQLIVKNLEAASGHSSLRQTAANVSVSHFLAKVTVCAPLDDKERRELLFKYQHSSGTDLFKPGREVRTNQNPPRSDRLLRAFRCDDQRSEATVGKRKKTMAAPQELA